MNITGINSEKAFGTAKFSAKSLKKKGLHHSLIPFTSVYQLLAYSRQNAYAFGVGALYDIYKIF